MDIGSFLHTLTSSLPTTVLLVLAFVVLWLLVSRVLRLAWKIISCGCVTIVALAIVLIAMHFLGR